MMCIPHNTEHDFRISYTKYYTKCAHPFGIYRVIVHLFQSLCIRVDITYRPECYEDTDLRGCRFSLICV